MKISKHIETAFMCILILWAVFAANLVLPVDLRMYGLRPRDTDWVWGILFSPFLHANYYHLSANSGALFVLLTMSLTFSRKLTFSAITVIILLGGSLAWLFGNAKAVHIGASGVIFGLIGFLIFSGFFRREWRTLFFSVVVFICYGGALYMLLIDVPGISWSGHFFGFLSGVIAAWRLRRKRI